MKSKLKSSTSRTQTPSRSPDNIPHTKGKNKKGKSKERRRMALNDEHRELLQANLKRISANFMDNLNENGGVSSSHRASKMMMRNQMSFGKRER